VMDVPEPDSAQPDEPLANDEQNTDPIEDYGQGTDPIEEELNLQHDLESLHDETPALLEHEPIDEDEDQVAESLEDTDEDYIDPNLRRSARAREPAKRLVMSFRGQRYDETAFSNIMCDAQAGTEMEQVSTAMGEDAWDVLTHYAMTQLSLKAGLKAFGKKGQQGVFKELSQLHWRDTFEPLVLKDLSKEEKEKALESHLFLKKKRDLTVKGRMVAGGDKQRGMIPKEEASSPTVSLESVMLTSAIDAIEERDVASADLPNAFVQTRLENEEDKVVMRLRGKLAELMVKVAPEIYRKYVIINKKGEQVLYVRLLNALYGLLKASLLFYKKLVKDLEGIGFVLNPYDPCVANKMIGGSQMTLCWHVDDMKISHKDPLAVDDFTLWLRHTYEEILQDGSGEMKVTRGKVHEYLGMTLDFSTRGSVKISMVPYVKEMINDFEQHDPCDKTATTPAGEHVFKVREDVKKLPEETAKIFHNFTAKALFVTKRSRPDIHVAVSFLTTRVREPDEDDWKKLVRMMRYLRGTPDLALTLSGDGTNIVKNVEWWIDAAHAVHPNMWSQTGAVSSMGKGGVMSTSVKQKINTHSSTETEIVAVDDLMPKVLWKELFHRSSVHQVLQSHHEHPRCIKRTRRS
jgi:Reverse transcriptase (RNA-dependent DNA polymerase)